MGTLSVAKEKIINISHLFELYTDHNPIKSLNVPVPPLRDYGFLRPTSPPVIAPAYLLANSSLSSSFALS